MDPITIPPGMDLMEIEVEMDLEEEMEVVMEMEEVEELDQLEVWVVLEVLDLMDLTIIPPGMDLKEMEVEMDKVAEQGVLVVLEV